MTIKRPTVRLESADFSCDRLSIRGLSGKEKIGQLFKFEVTIVFEDASGPTVQELLGTSVALVLEQGANVRRLQGMIARAVDLCETETPELVYQIEIVPLAHRLTLVRTQDIYVDASVPEIITKKLALAGLEKECVFRLPNAEKRYPKREFVIQYQESDLEFVSRLVEHIGISFFFVDDDESHKIVFTDHNGGFPIAQGGEHVPFVDDDLAVGIHRMRIVAEVIPDLYAVGDYNYEKPLVDLSGFCELPDRFGGGIIEYGPNVRDPEESAALARVRAEEHVARSLVYHCESTLPGLAAGTRFRLEGHARVPDAELLVIETEHRLERRTSGVGGAELAYANAFRAIPVEANFRPARVTPRPRIHGVLHGIVEPIPNSTSERPWIDEHGRYIIRVLFDTAEPGERPRASLPIRMAQAHSGRNFGIHFPLRPGTEVLLAFTGGDPDRPLIVGSVPNAVTPTPVVDNIATYHRIRTASGVLIEIDDGR